MRAKFFIRNLAILFLVGGCASTSAPPGYLYDAATMASEAEGGWIEISTSADGFYLFEGELLAISSDSVAILEFGSSYVAIPRAAITAAKLTPHTMRGDLIAQWVLFELVINFPIIPLIAGVESWSGHGFLYIFSAPVWIVGGIIMAAVNSHAVQLDLSREDWGELRQYARFPQGLPPNLDWSQSSTF